MSGGRVVHERPRTNSATARLRVLFITAYPLLACSPVGTTRRRMRPKRRSAATASMATGTAPASRTDGSSICSPWRIKSPSPPPPINAAIAAIPTFCTVAVWMPAIITGLARGSSTNHRRCASLAPMPRAASRAAGLAVRMPTYALRKMGNTALMASAATDGRKPIPPTGHDGQGQRQGSGEGDGDDGQFDVLPEQVEEVDRMRTDVAHKIP